MHKAREAFTLPELMVTLALVALLSLLAIGAGSRMQSFRQQTESAARLRQWAVALHAYTAENSGDLPRRGQGVQAVTQLDRPEDWFNALPPYLGERGYGALVAAQQRPHAGSPSVFIRPGATDPGGPVFLGYGMNMNLSPWNLPAPTRLGQVEHPSLTVFMAEAPGTYASTYPSTRPYGCLAPHSGQGNILFLDGHVSAFDAAYLGVGKGDPGRDDVRWLTGTISDAQAANYQ